MLCLLLLAAASAAVRARNADRLMELDFSQQAPAPTLQETRHAPRGTRGGRLGMDHRNACRIPTGGILESF